MKTEMSKFSSRGFAILIVSSISLLMNCKDDKPITVEPPCEDKVLGIYSETATDRLRPDVDSFFGAINGNGGSLSEFVDDNVVKIEGGISKRMTITVDGTQGQWAGWFVQNGTIVSPETEAKDMSAFKDGVLTFWVKTTINLEVGIRSSDVPPGMETSKVYLNNYPPFTPHGAWQKVSIPLAHFTGPHPKANLSKIKIFFVVASNTPSGGTGGNPATFWIDDVRWEKICEK